MARCNCVSRLQSMSKWSREHSVRVYMSFQFATHSDDTITAKCNSAHMDRLSRTRPKSSSDSIDFVQLVSIDGQVEVRDNRRMMRPDALVSTAIV